MFLRLQTRQRLFQTIGDGTLAAYVQMAVDVRGHLDVRVAQPLLHVLQTVALRQQHAGAGVSKLVEATNGYSLVEAKNDIWYDIASGYGFCRSLFY